MKKFINGKQDVVEEMLQGMVVLHPGLARLPGNKVALRADADAVRDVQVAVISGGGSGHEPAHAGYIGAGMLSAAVLGEVFTSPSSDAVFAAIKAVAGKPGAVLVVKNYTGDRLNFGLAAEMSRAEGLIVETVLVDDDVALKATGQAAGARGLAGTVLIHKVVGGAAAEGKSAVEVAAIGKAAVKALATMGVSLSAGTSPAVGKPSFELGANEMELGLGIHGEPGAQRTELQSADVVTESLLNQILKYGTFGDEKRIAVLVNNLGATTDMELAIIARHAQSFLEQKGFTIERMYAGTLLSSLDMAGISISVLGLNDDRLRWLDADTNAPAWPSVLHERPGRNADVAAPGAMVESSKAAASGAQTASGRKTRLMIEAACQALIAAEGELTELDRITGDGDLGTSMERAAKAIVAAVDAYPLDNAAKTLMALANTLRKELGGSSGPLYGVLFLRTGHALDIAGTASLQQWADAIEKGYLAISELGGANPGDRTMLDALGPFVQTLKQQSAGRMKDALAAALQATEAGAEATAHMQPKLGRSSYLGDQVLGHPDPGARAFAVWLSAALDTFVSQEAGLP